MLVLTRKRHEAIVIDHRVIVKIDKISDHSVKISIDAPKEIDVNRLEVELANERARRDEKGM